MTTVTFNTALLKPAQLESRSSSVESAFLLFWHIHHCANNKKDECWTPFRLLCNCHNPLRVIIISHFGTNTLLTMPRLQWIWINSCSSSPWSCPSKKELKHTLTPHHWSVCPNDLLMLLEKQIIPANVWKRSEWVEGSAEPTEYVHKDFPKPHPMKCLDDSWKRICILGPWNRL